VLTLHPEVTYRFTTRGPLSPTTGSPLGERQYFEMTAGTLTGDRINARIAMPGGDWMWRSPDGFWRPDVRVQLVTDDNAVVLLPYRGLVQQTEAFKRAASGSSETTWMDQYMRMFMTFGTGAEKYAWLNQSLFIAEGRLISASERSTRFTVSVSLGVISAPRRILNRGEFIRWVFIISRSSATT
jgi:hypothetical protein